MIPAPADTGQWLRLLQMWELSVALSAARCMHLFATDVFGILGWRCCTPLCADRPSLLSPLCCCCSCLLCPPLTPDLTEPEQPSLPGHTWVKKSWDKVTGSCSAKVPSADYTEQQCSSKESSAAAREELGQVVLWEMESRPELGARKVRTMF